MPHNTNALTAINPLSVVMFKKIFVSREWAEEMRVFTR
jgi:hypothetical protein